MCLFGLVERAKPSAEVASSERTTHRPEVPHWSVTTLRADDVNGVLSVWSRLAGSIQLSDGAAWVL